MTVIETEIPGVLLFKPRRFGDTRGFFTETFRAESYAAASLRDTFVQDNWSRSVRGVLRGLHPQNPNAQGKLVSVMRGEILDVAVDVRRGSPHYGRHVAARLSEENGPTSQILSTSATATTALRMKSRFDGTIRPSASSGWSRNLFSRRATRPRPHLPKLIACRL